MDKFFLRSKTILGALIAMLNPLLAIVGVEALSADQIGSLTDTALAWVDNLNELVGFGLVVWGRVSANPNLKLLPKVGGG